MKSAKRWACLILLAMSAVVRGDMLDVYIIDAAHTQSGDAIERWVSTLPETRVTRLDIRQFRATPAIESGVVVWLSPEASLFDRETAQRWGEIIGNNAVGLMIVGLPDETADCLWLCDVLRGRINIVPGERVGTHLEHASWIWSADKAQPTAAMKREFELNEVPARCWMQLAADNEAAVAVNGARVGKGENWRRPVAFDISPHLRRGTNVIAIDAKNEDGPAGVIASIQGRGADGKEVFRIDTDADWQGAKVLAPLGRGPWSDKVEECFASDEYELRTALKSPVAKENAAVGRAVVLRGLEPKGDGVTLLEAGEMGVAIGSASGRTIICGFDVERARDEGNGLHNDEFARFIGRSLLWLASRPAAPADGLVAKQAIAPTTKPALDRSKFFPVTMQLSPVPYEGARLPKALPDSLPAIARIIDNMIDHGITALQCPLRLPEPLARQVEQYAQQRGMGITYYFEHGLEGFDRDAPPAVSLYSQQYRDELAHRIERRLAALSRYPNLINVFTTRDEPFHAGIASFGYSEEERAEFRKRFGRELPRDPMKVRDDPRQWLDVINFRSDYFAEGWRELYRQIRARRPEVVQATNHDSHNTFGGAAGQEGKIFVDDVYHWGSDWADLMAFDIYPYLMKDFRYGPNRALMRPRMSATHYAFAHMRNLTQSGEKQLGFYFGTYHPEWFDLTPEGAKQFWQSREMIMTAVAGGTDFFIAGLNVPIESSHWEDMGSVLRTLQKASPGVLKAKPKAAKAAMLFPRTQCIQTQEEFFNVSQSFEAFQRAFGELDLIHEEQVARDGLGDRKILVLFDVKLLPVAVMTKIEAFVRGGGVVIADCVANEDALRRPSSAMGKLMGVRDAKTDRILWPVKANAEESPAPNDRFSGAAFGKRFDFPLVSTRPCTIDGGEAVAKTAGGAPAVVMNKLGRGRTYLLGFCVQDTSFEAWRKDDLKTIEQLNDLLAAIVADADITPAIWSSNTDIEAGLRVGEREAFVVVVAHEPQRPRARIRVGALPFAAAKVTDVETDRVVPFSRDGETIEIQVAAPLGTSQLIRLAP